MATLEQIKDWVDLGYRYFMGYIFKSNPIHWSVYYIDENNYKSWTDYSCTIVGPVRNYQPVGTRHWGWVSYRDRTDMVRVPPKSHVLELYDGDEP